MKTEGIGYFDSPIQTEPAYDPGLTAPCPFCNKPIGTEPYLSHSVLVIGDEKCYFYRYHKFHREELPFEEFDMLRNGIDYTIIDPIILRNNIEPSVGEN